MSYATVPNTSSEPTHGIWPIQKHDCPQKNPRIITTNDGNKTQQCLSCGWVWYAPGATFYPKSTGGKYKTNF